MRKLAVFTGTRADYGLIVPLLKEIDATSELSYQLVVMAAHLSPYFGHTIDDIKQDGFDIAATCQTVEKIEEAKDCAIALAKTVEQVTEVLLRLQPDAVVLTGDRYEMLGAASAALLLSIPIIHLYGGDITEGAYDDAIRHSLTKMASLHFCTNEASEKRILQMGEGEKYVFNVGSPALDHLRDFTPLPKEALEMGFRDVNLLVTYHPETRSSLKPEEQITIVLEALSQLDENHFLCFTMPGADGGAMKILDKILAFVAEREHAEFHSSLGYERYFSMLHYVDMVVGNSSSGLLEVPSFSIPTVNIGDRQKGRLKAASVIDVPLEAEEISEAIKQAKHRPLREVVNPYGDGHSAERIVAILKGIADFKVLIRKEFYEREWQ